MRGTLGTLAAFAKRLAAAGNDPEALEGLRRETHKIHGSAGSFGFMEASRLAAGMEATAKDWIARPGDIDMDRGGLTSWFVTRLAEMLKLPVPEAPSATPPRLVIRRPSTAQKAAAPPPSKPLAPPPKSLPKVAPVVPRRPSQPQSAPRPASPPPPPPAKPAPAKSVPKPPPPAPLPKPERQPAPKAAPQSIPWLVAPEESKPAQRPPETIPAPRKAAPPPPAAAIPAPAPMPTADSAVPELIVVEDDPALVELLEYGLRARGYRFVSFRNGRDALRELLALDVGAAHPVVLLDVDLPGLDGYSVLDGLQRDRPGVFRVVFTTVHGGEAEQLRGLEAGALDYLVKPISLRVALEKIRRWVGR